MKITKTELRKLIKEERTKILNESPLSPVGQEILSIKDTLRDIVVGVEGFDEELARTLQLQIDRLRELGFKLIYKAKGE
jgi:hypothetical protein